MRPTSDRVREAIFDVLEAQGVNTTRVLDLYAGSGALGIDALSRGADWCDFVERDAGSAAVVRENVATAGLQDNAGVHRVTVERVAGRLQGPYTLVFADPPYDDDEAPAALERVAASGLLAADATLVYEHGQRREVPQTLGRLSLYWSRRYGDTQVSIYRQAGAGAEEAS